MARVRRRLRLGDIGLAANSQTKKLVIYSQANRGRHVTLNLGGKSGIIDMHVTEELGDRLHETLIAIKSRDLPSLCDELGRQVPPERFFALLRPLRLGWLHHRHIGFLTGVFHVDHDGHSKVSTTADDLVRLARIPSMLEEIYEVPDQVMPLVEFRRGKPGRWIGLAYKVKNPSGEILLFWVKLRNLARLADQLIRECMAITAKYHIEDFAKVDPLP